MINRFTNEVPANLTRQDPVGLHSSIADFEHRKLYIGSGYDSSGSTPLVMWWKLSDPRIAVVEQRIDLSVAQQAALLFVPGQLMSPADIADFITRPRLSP